jgi:NAD(P)H-hydrate repair Nnr-like enzyme with NAD(P)H-hydrate dehydratase domain
MTRLRADRLRNGASRRQFLSSAGSGALLAGLVGARMATRDARAVAAAAGIGEARGR